MGKVVRSLYEKAGIKGASHACRVVLIQCIPVFKYIHTQACKSGDLTQKGALNQGNK